MTQPRLLLVDDEEVFVRTLSREMSELGWQVQTADDTEIALRALRQNEFDAVVLDQRRSGPSGVELLSELGRLLARPVAVLLSSNLSVATTVRAIQGGASDVLEKPVVGDRSRRAPAPFAPGAHHRAGRRHGCRDEQRNAQGIG